MSYKRILLILTFFIAIITNANTVKADSCITDAMQKEADQLQIYSTFNEKTKTYDVTVEGLTSDNIIVYLIDGSDKWYHINAFDNIKNMDSNKTYTYKTYDENGNLLQTIYYEDNKAIIKNISSNKYTAMVMPTTKTGCEETIRTEKLSLQSYNIYADDERCNNINIEEFPMCDPWYEGNITEESFNSAYNKYIESLNETEAPDIPKKVEKTDYAQIIFDFFATYYIQIIVGIIIVVIIGTIIQALLKRKKKPGDLL